MQEFDFRIQADPSRTCPVRIGHGVLDRLVRRLGERPLGHSIVLVADSNVAPLYAVPLKERLQKGSVEIHLLTFPAGEAHKTRETKGALEDQLLALGVGRDATIVAIGGGVTGDLAGFTAATWHRGIPVIQVPTTLLAMADAALGGKTGVDLVGGKNLVGAFHQPLAIYADVSTLETLPDAEFRAGFSEVIKSAVIADLDFFRWLEDSVGSLLQRDSEALEQAVTRCLRIKSRVVSRDERDEGRRAILNFGHTVAHALEAVSGYRISHGHAVGVGMVVEARLAVETTGFPQAHAKRLEGLVDTFGLPVVWPKEASPREVVAAARKDKKARAGEMRFALPRRLGRMPPGRQVTLRVDESRLREILEGFARRT